MPWVIAAVAVLAVAVAAWVIVRRRRRAAEASGPLRAIALLLTAFRRPDIPRLRQAVEKAWGITLPPEGQEDATDFIVGAEDLPSAVVWVGGMQFLVNFFPTPYFDDPEKAAEEIQELRTRSIVAQHKAWMSVDLLGDPPEGMPEQRVYSLLGKLAAELAGNDTLGFFLPQFERLYPYTTETLRALTSEDVLDQLREEAPLPVISVAEDDPRMKAAVEQAQSTIPEFLRRFDGRKPGDTFGLKFPLTSGDNTEFIWMLVDVIEGGRAVGRLDNDPANLPGYVAGQNMNVELDSAIDWIAVTDGKAHGGFTAKAMTDIHRAP